MPSLLGFAEEDPILQIEVDNSRNILYTRSEKGTVTVNYLEYLPKEVLVPITNKLINYIIMMRNK